LLIEHNFAHSIVSHLDKLSRCRRSMVQTHRLAIARSVNYPDRGGEQDGSERAQSIVHPKLSSRRFAHLSQSAVAREAKFRRPCGKEGTEVNAHSLRFRPETDFLGTIRSET